MQIDSLNAMQATLLLFMTTAWLLVELPRRRSTANAVVISQLAR